MGAFCDIFMTFFKPSFYYINNMKNQGPVLPKKVDMGMAGQRHLFKTFGWLKIFNVLTQRHHTAGGK